MRVDRNNVIRFLRNYRVGTLVWYRRIKKGFANAVCAITTTKGDYILKVAVRNNPVRVRYEVDLLCFLKNLPTPKPLRSRHGTYLLDFDGIHKAFMYPLLSGTQHHRFTRSMFRQVGRFLGQYHLQSRQFHSKVHRFEFYNISSARFQRMVRVGRHAPQVEVRRATVYLASVFRRYRLPPSLPQGAMHIDVKPENVLFSGGRLRGIIDFDNAYLGPILLDLANTMMWFCSRRGRFDLEGSLAIAQAYNAVRPLGALERRSLFKAVHYAAVSHVLVDIDMMLHGRHRLPLSYIRWGIKNLLETERRLSFTHEEFDGMLANV
ncbi:MAG: phosphotransferase [Candidatus Kerfeldbacteria bacterium]